MSSDQELLRGIRITHVLDCLADPSKIRVMAEFSDNVREALPYLAALLPKAGYNHAAGILTLAREGRLITVYPHMATIAKALDEEDAAATLAWLQSMINQAYGRRGELTPCLERRCSPRLLDVYQLLPRTNCKRCGYATCLAMATHLTNGEAHLADCPGLSEPDLARNRAILAEWLGEADAIVQ